jgi:tight adherence protein B
MGVLGAGFIGVAVMLAVAALILPPVAEEWNPARRRFWRPFFDVIRTRNGRALFSVAAGLLLGSALTGDAPSSVLGVPCVWCLTSAAFGYFDRRALRRRGAQIREQLPSALITIAGALQAGRTVEQSLELAGDSLLPPLGEELGQTCRELALGVSLEEALKGLRDRCGVEELDIAVCGLTMHDRLGGDLVGFFRSTAELSTARDNVRQELWAASAAPRLSTVLLILVPWVFVLLANMVTKLLAGGIGESYVKPLLDTSAGRGFLVTALVMQVVGWLISRQIVNVEV